MTTVKILIEGYVCDETGGKTCSTITLVKDGDLNMIVDPGTVSDPKVLINVLAKENLSVEDINIIGLTHSHIDHSRSTGMFPKAKILDHTGSWEGDIWTELNNKVTDNIQILKTPGHSDDSITFLVQTDEGVIAICGDVFWKENEPKKDPYAVDHDQLNKSRQLILNKVDYIIPGHGGKFKVK